MLKLESGSATSFSVENSLLKRLQTCRKRDNEMNEMKTFKPIDGIPQSADLLAIRGFQAGP